MPIRHDDVMTALTPERRARIEARSRELLAEESTLVETRLEEQETPNLPVKERRIHLTDE